MSEYGLGGGMFKDRTLFVLGAGASYDFGFPLGSSLKTAIIEAIQFDLDPIHDRPRYTSDSELVFRSASVEWRKDWGEIHELASQISGGLGFASSIDTFLHLRRESPGIAVLAKHAIAHAIASRERANEALTLFATPTTRVRSNQFDQNWVQIFSEICFDGADQSQLGLALRRFRVISFNYDRCLEQFIRIAVRSIYNLDEARTESFCQSLAFIHPYGSLGALSVNNAKRLDFGSPHFSLAKAAGQIRTFTEQANDPSTGKAIEDAIKWANRIVFLGFGFHRQNMDILKPESNNARKRIIGTALNVSESAQQFIVQRLKENYTARSGAFISDSEPRVNLEKMDCRQLLEEYRHELVE